MKEVIVKENLELFSEIKDKPNDRGYIGYKFVDSKRFASAKVEEDSKGQYFISKKIKFYI